MNPVHLCALLTTFLAGCKQGPYHSDINQKLFQPGESVGVIADADLKEASGIEASHLNPGMYWTHNDSGGAAKLYLIDRNGILHMTVKLQGARNRDWEDLTLIKGEKTYLYIGDIGDNLGKRKSLRIYKIEEPKYEGQKELEIEKEAVETMNFTYENGARDAETLLSGTREDELIIVSKRDTDCLVYDFEFVRSKEIIELEPIGKIALTGFTAGDANEAGEILLKNYDEIFYWKPSDESIAERIANGPDYRIPYKEEPQGEAICWDGQGNFLTVSEFHPWSRQYIYFYERKE